MNKKKWFIGLCMIAACFALTGMAFGAWAVQQNTDNFLTMASYKARITETYQVPDHVNPSEEIEKIVQVKNEGTVPILVRVLVEKAFGVRGSDGVFIPDSSLDTDVIEISYNHTWWEKREDGWFYYKDVLRAGETTKEPLMESYCLSSRAGNEYKGKDAEIVIHMESMQAGEDTVSAWNVTLKDLGIRWEDQTKSAKTGVTFKGREEGFDVTADQTDLFASFKNLQPGCTRSQMITVQNQSSEPVELFLRAEETKQQSMSKGQRKLVRQLMEKYAVIEITEGDKTLYQGAVCGKDDTDSMQQDISLGTFPAGSSKDLLVKLTLSPQMDNRFQALAGKATWVFSARAEDGAVMERKMPITGDVTSHGMWIALFVVSGLSLWFALLVERKNRRMEHEIFEEDI